MSAAVVASVGGLEAQLGVGLQLNRMWNDLAANVHQQSRVAVAVYWKLTSARLVVELLMIWMRLVKLLVTSVLLVWELKLLAALMLLSWKLKLLAALMLLAWKLKLLVALLLLMLKLLLASTLLVLLAWVLQA